MQNNNPSKRKITFKRRITLIILGVFLFFALLEASLRLGGFILLSAQGYGNSQTLKQKGAYRILCLGESTTERQYPQLLEEILNQRNIGVRFSVVDKGLSGTNTTAILSLIEFYLAEYRPDAVVAMMGCNDSKIMYYQDIPNSETWLFKHCRVYRFSRILYMHILKKIKKEGIYGVNALDADRKVKLEDAEIVAEKINLPLEGPIDLNPKNENAYVELGQINRDQEKFTQPAEELFKKAIEFNPKNDNAYVELGWLYQSQGKFFQAEDLLKKAIESNPKNNNAYVGLAWLYRSQGKFPQAEELLKKAIKLNPKNNNAYVELGWSYYMQGKLSDAEASFKKAIELNFENDKAYVGLGWLYQKKDKFSQAEESFKKALELNPENDKAYGSLLAIYEKLGKLKLQEEYTKKINRLKSGYCNLVTVSNYRKLKEILDKRGIRLVCVQYPMRSIGPLRKIFDKDEGIIFVDNENVFKEALKKSSYKEYFTDMFGDDFGHCTEKGNRLLAGNIANTVLKKIFGK